MFFFNMPNLSWYNYFEERHFLIAALFYCTLIFWQMSAVVKQL